MASAFAIDRAALLCDKQVAALLGISLSSLRHARSDRRDLPAPLYIKIGGRIYYERAVVLAWARERGIPIAGAEQRREVKK